MNESRAHRERPGPSRRGWWHPQATAWGCTSKHTPNLRLRVAPSGWVETSPPVEAGFRALSLLARKRTCHGLPFSPKSIGILRTGFIGDVILTTGMIRHVKDRYPQARLHYFCYSSARPIIEDNPRVDRVWSPSWLPLRRLGGLLRLEVFREMRAFMREARRERIDLLLVPCRQQTLLGTLKVALVVWMIQPGTSVGLCYRNRGFFLDIKVPDEGLLVRHESDWCADILRAAGIPGDCRVPCIEVHPQHERSVSRLLESHGIRPNERLVIIHPGGGSDASEPKWTLKRWPAANFARVAGELARMDGVRVLVTGVEAERPLFQEMTARGIAGVTDLIGRTSLKEFSALARRAALVIGNDSGATHVAAACGAPTIALFGYTDFIGYHPLGARVSLLRHATECAPCLYWFGRVPCQKSYSCLRSVRPEQVVAEARRLMAAHSAELRAALSLPKGRRRSA